MIWLIAMIVHSFKTIGFCSKRIVKKLNKERKKFDKELFGNADKAKKKLQIDLLALEKELLDTAREQEEALSRIRSMEEELIERLEKNK